ncbi:MAG: GTP cyclohydrolase, FolE2/MptA family, partial [bacterium]|nr:GTP cyclohydrolase, FolE2/MptA family [bacterium]
MRDIQNEKDERRIEVDRVGVKEILYPIIVMDKRKEQQSTVASINMYVNLPHHFRGTHMSRFIEVLNQHRGAVSLDN